LSGGLPAILASIHAVCGSRRRAMAIAIMYFTATLFGSGLGPLVTGALSDWLSPSYGAQSLRVSLMTVVTVLLIAGAAFYKCARALPGDLEA
jgi:MFS family permease